jgi:FkbM family methyltransferase
MPKVCDVASGLRFLAENSLEEYRAETILTKEPETIAWIDAQFTAGEVLLDIGANVGIYSCYAAGRQKSGRVYAVEPVLRNFVRLCENVHLNGFDNVMPFFLGFSDRTGIETLFIRDDRTGGSGSQIGHAHDEHGQSFEPVGKQPTLVFTVDGFLATTGLPAPHHVKIDVDGNEGQIIGGMRKALAATTLRSVLVELNLASDTTTALVREIESYGFTRDNEFNSLADHSRNRRRSSPTNVAENLIFTRTAAA